jgi:hypothetical protein
MTHYLTRRLGVIVGAACAFLIVMSLAPASAAVTSRVAARDRVAAYLATHPGGQPISDNEISYGGGALVVTLTPPSGVLGVPDCPRGWYCFYDRVSFGYPRGKLSSCGQQYLGTWGWQFRTESAHYNLSSGYVVFYYYSTALFDVGVGNRTRADAYPYRNQANYVLRVC